MQVSFQGFNWQDPWSEPFFVLWHGWLVAEPFVKKALAKDPPPPAEKKKRLPPPSPVDEEKRKKPEKKGNFLLME